MRAVLDTNVLVSGILHEGTSRGVLDAARRRAFEWSTSPVLLRELEEVLERFLPRPVVGETLTALEELAVVVEPADVPRVTRDPDDDHVVAAAVAAGASFLVTGDKDLMALAGYEGFEIIAPVEFLRVLAQAPEGSEGPW